MRGRTQAIGAAGEGHARRFLEAKGYAFVAANWRCRWGELDLILWDGDELVFVEVKTRRGDLMGRAGEAVGPEQTKRILRAARSFIHGAREIADRDPIWRVDLIAITLKRTGVVRSVEHYENAIGEW